MSPNITRVSILKSANIFGATPQYNACLQIQERAKVEDIENRNGAASKGGVICWGGVKTAGRQWEISGNLLDDLRAQTSLAIQEIATRRAYKLDHINPQNCIYRAAAETIGEFEQRELPVFDWGETQGGYEVALSARFADCLLAELRKTARPA